MKVKELLDLLSNPEIPADAEIVVKQFERGDEPEWYSRGTLFPDLGSSAPSTANRRPKVLCTKGSRYLHSSDIASPFDTL